MKKIVLVYGCIAGFILAAWMIGFAATGISEDFENGMIYGYASMIIAFSFVYVGIYKYKQQMPEKQITFKQGFLVGLYITLISSTFYVLAWLFVYYNMAPDFMEKYLEFTIGKMKAANAPQSEIDTYIKDMQSFNEMYKNPFVNMAFTYMEVLPVGLLISAISTFLVKRRK